MRSPIARRVVPGSLHDLLATDVNDAPARRPRPRRVLTRRQKT